MIVTLKITFHFLFLIFLTEIAWANQCDIFRRATVEKVYAFKVYHHQKSRIYTLEEFMRLDSFEKIKEVLENILQVYESYVGPNDQRAQMYREMFRFVISVDRKGFDYPINLISHKPLSDDLKQTTVGQQDVPLYVSLYEQILNSADLMLMSVEPSNTYLYSKTSEELRDLEILINDLRQYNPKRAQRYIKQIEDPHKNHYDYEKLKLDVQKSKEDSQKNRELRMNTPLNTAKRELVAMIQPLDRIRPALYEKYLKDIRSAKTTTETEKLKPILIKAINYYLSR